MRRRLVILGMLIAAAAVIGVLVVVLLRGDRSERLETRSGGERPRAEHAEPEEAPSEVLRQDLQVEPDPATSTGTSASVAALFGKVRDTSGRAVRSARVELSIGTDPRFQGSALSGPEGDYRIDAWPNLRGREVISLGLPNITATAEGFAPLLIDPYTFSGSAPGDQRLDLWLTRGSTLMGVVLADDDGRPIEGASIALLPVKERTETRLLETTTARDGSITLEPIRSRTIDALVFDRRIWNGVELAGLVEVSASGFARCRATVELLDEGESEFLEITLLRSGALH